MVENPEKTGPEKAVPPDLLELLICPACHGSLEQKAGRLLCRRCAVAYPIRDGVPVMLTDQAEPLQEGEPASGNDEQEQQAAP
jgi:hypothetical protein